MLKSRIIILFLFFVISLNANNSGINDSKGNPVPGFLLKKISFITQNTSISDALTKLSKDGNFYLNYNSKIFKAEKTTSLNFKETEIAAILHNILKNTYTGFVVTQDEQVVLYELNDPIKSKKYTISGFVADKETGEALLGTNIYLSGLTIGCISNLYGFYSLTVPEGEYSIIYSFAGYESEIITQKLDQNKILNIELSESPYSMDTVVVKANLEEDFVKSTKMGTITLVPKENSKIPVLLGEQDIFRVIQLLPGVAQSKEADCGFYVRGGNSDQNLILLDEAPVYNAFHMLGTFSVFNSDAIKDVKLIKGSAPARYGGKLSSVIDIQMKEGNKKEYRGDASIGLIFSRVTYEGPLIKDRSSFMISGRRTYADIFTSMSDDETVNNSSLYFYDFNVKTNLKLNESNRIYLSGYFGNDLVAIAGDENDGSAEDVSNDWGNKTVTFRWNHIYNEKLFSNSSLIFSQFKYGMNIESDQEKIENSSAIDDLTLKTDFQYFINPGNNLNFGLYYVNHLYQPAKILVEDTERLDLRIGEKSANEAGAYISHEWQINADLKIEYGTRYTMFLVDGEDDNLNIDQMEEIPQEFDDIEFHKKEHTAYHGFEPRFTANYLLSPLNSVKFGYARNFQNVHLLSSSTAGTPLSVWHPSSSSVKPQYADQFSLGFFQNYWEENLEISLEVYYKDMQNQIDYKDGADLLLSSYYDSELAFGRGWAYGAEFFVKKQIGKLTGWIGYTISKSARKFSEINDGKSYPATYDRTHDFAIVGIYKLNERWTFSANWIYQTGMAITMPYGKYIIDGRVIEAYTERNAFRMPAYHRMDIGITYETQNGGTWNFTLYNAYGQRNAYSIYFRNKQGSRQIKEAVKLSLFSYVPSLSYSFTF